MLSWCTTCSSSEYQSLLLCLLHEIGNIFLSHSVFLLGICTSASSQNSGSPLHQEGSAVLPLWLPWDKAQFKWDVSSASLNTALWVWVCGFLPDLWTLHHLRVDSPCGLVQTTRGWIHTVFSQVKLHWLVPSNIFCMFPVYTLNLWGRSGQKVGNLLLLM